MPKIQDISNSTYGVYKHWSYQNEIFYSISTNWSSGSRPIIKIRVANWKPKQDRSCQAIFYYDVQTTQEAKDVLNLYQQYDFKSIEQEYEQMWHQDNFIDKGHFNTGETDKWWNDKFYPYIRNKFPKL